MAKNWKAIQAEIAKMARKDLENLLVKAMRSHETFFQYVWVNHLDKEYGTNDLFDQYLGEMNVLLAKGYRGASEELRAANMIDTCRKHLDNFSKVSGDKEKALVLALHVLESPITNFKNFAGTCFTKYDYAYFLLFGKAKTLFYSMHTDIQHEYRNRMQTLLNQLKKSSRHLNQVYD
jgi:hypothetical protein